MVCGEGEARKGQKEGGGIGPRQTFPCITLCLETIPMKGPTWAKADTKLILWCYSPIKMAPGVPAGNEKREAEQGVRKGSCCGNLDHR